MERVTNWRKASYSSTNGGACVEVGNADRGVAVRDTTDHRGPVLVVKAGDWHSFVVSIKSK
jgi:hypothetical protein